MHKLGLQNLSTDQLFNVAEGLARGGNEGSAVKIYEIGAREAVDDGRRFKFQMRLGLLAFMKPYTHLLLEIAGLLEREFRQVFVGDGLATWNKRAAFMTDGRFLDLTRQHASLLPLPNWHWNLQTALWAVQQCRNVPGDFVELGVFRGHTTLFLADYIQFADWPKQWWLYDTFSGIPADQVDAGWEKINDDLYGGTYSFAEVHARFATYDNIQVIQGRVPEVLEQQSPEQISFLHVDLNNAMAEVAALDTLFDRISPGGIILFDDYAWANCTAQTEAEDAWFARRGERILALPTGQGLYVKRAL